MKLIISQADLLTRFQRELPELKEIIVEGLVTPQADTSNTFNPNVLPLSIGAYLKVGNLVGAVKEARTLYGLQLKEAKDYVEQYMYRPGNW